MLSVVPAQAKSDDSHQPSQPLPTNQPRQRDHTKVKSAWLCAELCTKPHPHHTAKHAYTGEQGWASGGYWQAACSADRIPWTNNPQHQRRQSATSCHLKLVLILLPAASALWVKGKATHTHCC